MKRLSRTYLPIYILLLQLFLVFVPCVAAETASSRFDVRKMFRYAHISAADGLMSQRVFSIVEGKDHAIWIATKTDVERYNGMAMDHYSVSLSNAYSNASGLIIRLYKSHDGSLYAFTNSGQIFLYDIVSDSFKQCLDLVKLFNRDIILNDMFIQGNRTWLALNTGLYYVSGSAKPKAVLNNVYVNSINEGRNGIFACANIGVFSIDFAKLRPVQIFKNINVQSSYYDKTYNWLWMGTFNSGLFLGDVSKRSLFPESPDVPHRPVRAITPLNSETMLVGIDGGGVAGIARFTGKRQFILSTDDETGGMLHGNGIYAICRDEWDNIWIGSYSGGVDVCYAVDNRTKVISHEYLTEQSLFNNNVNAVYDDGAGNMYYATDRGVSVYHSSTGTWTHLLKNIVCLSIARGIDGNIVVATYGAGVRSLDGTAIYTKDNRRLQTDYVFSLYNDGRGNLWVGCLDGDLTVFSSAQSKRYHIQNVQSISNMPDGRVAIATAEGFYAIDGSGDVSHYFTAGEVHSQNVNLYVMSMLFTSKSEVWLGTDGGGIYIYNMRLNSFRQLTTANGLPSNNVKGIIADKQGRIWVTTDHGVVYILRKPSLKIVAAGLPFGSGIEFNRNAVSMLKDGNLVFGSTSGALIVYPKLFNGTSYDASLQLRDVLISGLSADKESEMRPRIYEMLQKGRVDLPYSQNTFTLTFESINLRHQYDIGYQYYIEGQQHNALQTVNDGSILFNSLAPGTYRLHIRSISFSNNQVLDERVVEIHIHEPWWNTWWAWLLYIVVAAVVGTYAWRFYRNRIQRQYDEERINFFVNTAHDIRTPLSLTLAPLDDIAKDKTLDENSRNYLDIARRNGRQLMTIITTLLDFQKADTRRIQLHVKQLDLRSLLERACSRFHLLSQQKHITLSLTSCPDGVTVWMDEEAANRILDNLISNAIKYSRENGVVEVSASTDENHIYINVKDNGIGIPAKSQKKIFKTFYRAENAVRSKVTGSGLGLMLVRRLVELHHGTVTFNSEENKGTTFTITLEKGFTHLKQYIDNEDSNPSVMTLAASSHETASTVDNADSSRPIVLFVDDNAELRNYMKTAFSNDYVVVTQPDAQSALDYLVNNSCDIIISDVMMPGIQGDEFCRRVKENVATSFIPVILLTANVGRDFTIGGLNCGADDYVTKPFDTAVLRAKISSILRNRQKVRDYYLHRATSLVHEAPASEKQPSAQVEAKVDKETKQPDNVTLDDDDKSFIDDATRIVMENMQDEDFDVNSLCREMAMSRTLFYSRLKSLTGQAPQEFLRLLRLERAAKLLEEGKTVQEASFDTGFSNSKYFSTLFKKHFGVSPSKYKA